MTNPNQEQMQKLLKKYVQNECTPEEAKQVQLWYETLDLYSADPVVEPEQKSSLKAQLWAGIQENLSEEEPQVSTPKVLPTQPNRIRPLLRPFLQVGVAAAILLTLGLVFWQNRLIKPKAVLEANVFIEKVNHTDHATPYELMDGSIVWLKPQGILRYPNHFRSAQREVYLEGEAFFEVAHDAKRPFRVYSNQLIVRVLGTSFTVKAYRQANTAEVTVRTGRVTVYSRPTEKGNTNTDFVTDKSIEEAEKTSVVLVPNQKIIFHTNSQQLVQSQVKQPDYWEKEEAQHRFTFMNAPLEEVMHALEETYRISIHLENAELKNCTLTATLGNQPLDTKLEMICKSVGATFEKRDSAVYISGKGCE